MDKIKIIKRFLKLEMKDIAFVKFIIESYEGIAVQRTINAKNGVIEIMVPSSNEGVLENIISDLMNSIPIKEIEKPDDYFEL